MKFYSGIVKCGTCGVALSKAINVPEDRLLEAAINASERAFCAGHSKNSNLDFVWEAQAGEIEAPAPAPAEPAFKGVMINMPDKAPAAASSGEVPAPSKITSDGIAIEDLAEAAGVDPSEVAIVEDAVYIGAPGENGVPQPMRVIGKNAPRPDQLG